jgi:hypothetical protein
MRKRKRKSRENTPPHLADAPFVLLLKFVVSGRHHHSKIKNTIKKNTGEQKEIRTTKRHTIKLQEPTHRGSIFSIILRLLSLLLSACLKNLDERSRAAQRARWQHPHAPGRELYQPLGVNCDAFVHVSEGGVLSFTRWS